MIRLPWHRRALPQAGERPAADSASNGARSGSSDSGADSSDTVSGERGASVVAGARSLQSRMSSLLAAGLMTSVGAAMLAWYYAEALSHPASVHGGLHSALPPAPGGEMMLPPFGTLTPPGRNRPDPMPPAGPTATALPASQPAAAALAAALPASARSRPPLARAPGEPTRGYGAPVQPSPRQRRLDRRLSGNVFAEGSLGTPTSLAASPQPADSARRGGDALQRLLRPAVLAGTRAQMLPTQHLLLPKGTFIDCTLETAIDSTLPGMTTCITATDTFSADGTVVLLERGTKLIGETRGEVRQGQARVFVVWMEARTPAGVVVRLDSPGTDALGRSGLEGTVERHFWQRFGAAALVSTIDGVVQSQVQSSARSGTVVIDPTASEDVLTGILRSTVNIPPTIRVWNGARIQVLVARDVDFRPVYELHAR